MKQKVGRVADQIKTGKIATNYATGDFVGVCDGVTFGILGGQAYHSSHNSKLEWSPEAQVRWAKANAEFFMSMHDKLSKWADVVAKENNLKPIL